MPETWRETLESEFGKEIFVSGFQGEILSTGSLIVDYLTGIGGIPLGHYVEIFGSEGCGKTTLALSIIREALSKGKAVLYEDYEGTVSDIYLKRMGIDPKVLEDYRVTPKSMEEGWMIKKRFCEDNAHRGGIIIVDSVAAMPPLYNVEKMNEIVGHTKVGSQAQVMSVALNEMTRLFLQSQVSVIFINQERANIDLVRGMAAGKTTPGGNAIRFYSSIRINLQAKGSVTVPRKNPLEGESKEVVTAVKIGVRVVKNKFGASYRDGQMIIRMNEGIDNLTSALLVAQKAGLIERRGPYYDLNERYSGDSLGKKKIQGGEKLRLYFEEDEEIRLLLMKDVSQYLKTNLE